MSQIYNTYCDESSIENFENPFKIYEEWDDYIFPI